MPFLREAYLRPMSQHPAELLNNIIRERRSVKPGLFKPGEPIPGDVIRQALTNATWAPNHGKTEPWHFIAYTGEGIKRLSEFQSELYKQESGEKFTEAKYKKLKEDYQKASHVIAICLKRHPESRIPEIEEICAVAASVQNLALTLHAYGYGGYWTTGGVTYYESAKAFFDLGVNDRLMGFYLCGVPAALPPVPSRKTIAEKTTWYSR
jgi:nitroreductase